MAIRILNISPQTSESGATAGFGCSLAGDGTSTTITVNLSKDPFEFKFDNLPDEVDASINGTGLPSVTSATVAESHGEVTLSITLSAPLDNVPDAANADVGMTVTFAYNT
jgi:hypothetical protein